MSGRAVLNDSVNANSIRYRLVTGQLASVVELWLALASGMEVGEASRQAGWQAGWLAGIGALVPVKGHRVGQEPTAWVLEPGRRQLVAG